MLSKADWIIQIDYRQDYKSFLLKFFNDKDTGINIQLNNTKVVTAMPVDVPKKSLKTAPV